MILTGFRNRAEAGQSLARQFERFTVDDNVVVLGLPRGGVPPAFEIAKVLKAPLDVFVVGKLGFPGQPELALGAVTSNGSEVINPELLEHAGLSKIELDKLSKSKIRELAGKESLFRRGNPAVPLKGRTIILVDDGSATGASMRVALQALRRLGPEYIIAAVPVASFEALQSIQDVADETVCLQTPEPFHAVGHWYEDFQQVTDEEVIQCLDRSRNWSRITTDREKSGFPQD